MGNDFLLTEDEATREARLDEAERPQGGHLDGFDHVRIRLVVLAVFFVVLFAGQLVDGTDIIFGLGVACFWTGAFALLWEFVARAVNRTRDRPNAT